MAKVKIVLSYDGTDFSGWQKQKTGEVTIQGLLEEKLSRMFDQQISVKGSGRTDAGVHALGQTAHFEVNKDLHKYDIVHSLNQMLPESISVRGAWEAPKEFHAMNSSVSKTYLYQIYNHPIPTALGARFYTWLPKPLDIQFFQEASQYLVKKQDFKSFQTTGTEVLTTTREIFTCEWSHPKPHVLQLKIVGDGFLKQMVRNIVGTLIDLHRFQEKPSKLLEILEAKDRRKAGQTAPPEGLYLWQVNYPQELDKRCRKL